MPVWYIREMVRAVDANVLEFMLFLHSQYGRVCADGKAHIRAQEIPLGKGDWSFASLRDYQRNVGM